MKRISLWGAAAGLLLFSATAHATSLTMDLSTEFSGGDAPVGPTPWLTAVFDDENTAGSVLLTLNGHLTDEESVKGWYFNLDPTLNPADLAFGFVDSSSGAPSPVAPATSVNGYKADGDGYFDILFSFPTSGELFDDSDWVTWEITGIGGLVAGSFDFPSAPGGGNGTWLSAAHIQRIGLDGEGSGWIGANGGGQPPPVPEPATMVLVGMGLAGIAGLKRKAL